MALYQIHAAFKDGKFLVIIEKDVNDPTIHRLRIAELLSLDDQTDLGYWAASSLGRAMWGAADFYAAEMEKARQELDGDEPDAPDSRR
jgi:hypothetical protein